MKKKDAIGFDAQISSLLDDAGISFQRDVALGGFNTDFVVKSQDGRTFVVETKDWKPGPDMIAKAAHQAELIKKASGADEAFVVIQNLKEDKPNKNVLSIDSFLEMMKILKTDQIEKVIAAEIILNHLEPQPPKPLIFAAMPFSDDYEDTFYLAMAPAAKSVKAVCNRAKDPEHNENIIKKMEAMIRKSVCVIADLSNSNPNVFYEAGFAHGIDKPVVYICSTSLEDLPFDVAQWNVINYKRGQTHLLKGKLINRLKAVKAKSCSGNRESRIG